MSPAGGEARRYNQLVRDCVLDILRETWPMPWPTPWLQDAFSPRDFQRVNPALHKLLTAGEVARFPEQRWNYWVAIGDPVGPPTCRCGRPAKRVICLWGKGGYYCGEQDHFADVMEQDWPWPGWDSLSETLAVVR